MLFKVTLVEELFDPTIEGSLLRVTSLGRLYFDPIISKGTHYPSDHLSFPSSWLLNASKTQDSDIRMPSYSVLSETECGNDPST